MWTAAEIEFEQGAPPGYSVDSMPICKLATRELIKLLGEPEAHRAIAMSQRVDKIEAKWRSKLETQWRDLVEGAFDSLEKTGKPSFNEKSLEDFFTKHFFEVAFESIKSTNKMTRVEHFSKSGMPRSLKEVMKLWDEWRTKGKVPPAQKQKAKEIKKDYLDAVMESWKKHSKAYREGSSADRQAIISKVKDESSAPYSRAKNMVETSTTTYWNQARKDVYDESRDVTHYLAVAIRDFRTSKWCADYKRKGRNGLVYRKDHPELNRGPAWHWYCRTEILPLTPQNPRHKALIDDESRSRDRNSPEPLPPGWGR